jgi:hypothetical protein
MKNIFLKFGVFMVIGAFLVLGGQSKSAEAIISDVESTGLLSVTDKDWNSLDNLGKLVKIDVYQKAINVGMTHTEALGEANYIYKTIPDIHQQTTSGSILSSVQNTGWKYDEKGIITLNTAATYQPAVSSEDRNKNYIEEQIAKGNQKNNTEGAIETQGHVNNSKVTFLPTLTATTAPTCATEGVEGVDFLVFHGPLVPCGVNKAKTCDTTGMSPKDGEKVRESGKPCTICHFMILIKNVFDLLLSLIITASLLMLTIAGVMYIVSSGGQLTGMAKGIIEKTLLGFGIFLLSWLLVYTLLNMLSIRDTVVGKGSRSTWFQFECDTKSSFYTLARSQTPNPVDESQTPISETDDGTSVNLQGISPRDITPYPQSINQLSASEVRARKDLVSDSGNNIAVWESGIGRTDIETLRPETRQGILKLQNAVGQKITVTGGAEADGPHTDGIYSHANGYKADIEDDTAVNNYIVNNYEYLGNRAGDGARVYTDGNNNYMAREGSHWDGSFNRLIPVPLQ